MHPKIKSLLVDLVDMLSVFFEMIERKPVSKSENAPIKNTQKQGSEDKNKVIH
jgi:hypothetical protein